jgi:hypothetical protein
MNLKLLTMAGAAALLAGCGTIKNYEQLAQPTGQDLARIPHKPVEQMGGRGVRELENTELYDDPFYRPEADRLY